MSSPIPIDQLRAIPLEHAGFEVHSTVKLTNPAKLGREIADVASDFQALILVGLAEGMASYEDADVPALARDLQIEWIAEALAKEPRAGLVATLLRDLADAIDARRAES